MKKMLLFSSIMCFTLAAFAQSQMKAHPVRENMRSSEMLKTDNNMSVISNYKTPSMSTADMQNYTGRSSQGRELSFIKLGSAGNAYSTYYYGRTYLWADNNINSVVFIHRMRSTPGSGYIAYDLSTDAGQTWDTAIQVYNPSLFAPYGNARYPQVGIFNPPGNTDPANAYLTYFVPVLDNSNYCGTDPAPLWGGLGYGVNSLLTLDPPAPTQTNESTDEEFSHVIPAGYTVTQNGDVWALEENQPCESNAWSWDGRFGLYHGVWDPDEGDIVFEKELLEVLTTDDAVMDNKIAFAPDGQTGYILFLAWTDSDPQDFHSLHPLIVKTTDGGETWDDPVHVLLGGYDGIEAIKQYFPDEAILNVGNGYYQEGFDRDTVSYFHTYHTDLVVDAYGNPHFTGLITIADSGYYYTGYGYMATFHFWSPDGGQTFDAAPLYDNLTYDGTLGTLPIYNRPQISSDITGKFLFMSCLDTDFTGVTDNNQPDIFCCSYDIDKDEYTEMVNVTEFTPAWLIAYDGCQSHYVFSEVEDNTLTCTVPFIYMQPGKNAQDAYDETLQATYWYIGGWTYEFTVESPYQPPTGLTGSYLCYDVTLDWLAPGIGTPIGYNIYCDNVKINIDPVPVLSYTDAGVTPGSHTYKVTAAYSGGESVPTAPVTLTVESLDPITNLLITNEMGTPDVYLTWSAPTREFTGYNVYRNDVLLTPTPITETFYNDLGLESGAYTYCVKAIYQSECESEAVCGEILLIIDGIKEIGNGFWIYPNPAKETLTVQFTIPVQSVKILNDMGSVIYSNEKINRKGVLNVNVSSFEPGVYFLQVTTDKGIATKKLTIN